MKSNKGRDTGPELKIRRLVHASGLRYRVQWQLPFDRRRRADMAFPGEKVVVFIDGCFWHRCPEHFVRPKTNATFWEEKMRSNVERDVDTDGRMHGLGWTVIHIWEHEDPAEAAIRLENRIRALRVEGMGLKRRP